MAEQLPAGWPGEFVLEGNTPVQLPENLNDAEPSDLGPRRRQDREVFHNPAMAANRTRSVLLMASVLESEWLASKEKTVRILDGLAATGIRARRLLHELPLELAKRVDITVADQSEAAILWAQANHEKWPPASTIGGWNAICGDVRQICLNAGWQWVDVDPFGSPMPFLDAVLQSTARKSVLEISATDTAALTGSSRSALLRRYGARARLDSIAHDTGLRILLGKIASEAAKHDRAIEPLLSIWDGHHLRVSCRVIRSVEQANVVAENLGWRLANPTIEEGGEDGEPHILLPFEYPVNITDKRVSGPLWTGPLGDRKTMQTMSEERAIELCAPSERHDFSESEMRLRQRAVARAVRHIVGEAEVIHSPTLLVVDDLPALVGTLEPPSPAKLAQALSELGHPTAVAAYGKPAIRTTAPWKIVAEVVKNF